PGHPMNSTRRRFLQVAAGSATLAMADRGWLSGLAAFGAETPPDKVRYGPDLEPVVRLIEETPRDRCVAVFIDKLRRGLPYSRFLAANFYAGVRRQISHHDVYKIHAVHQVSQDVRAEERLLPLFWSVNAFKVHQEDFPAGSLLELTGAMPSTEKAA